MTLSYGIQVKHKQNSSNDKRKHFCLTSLTTIESCSDSCSFSLLSSYKLHIIKLELKVPTKSRRPYWRQSIDVHLYKYKYSDRYLTKSIHLSLKTQTHAQQTLPWAREDRINRGARTWDSTDTTTARRTRYVYLMTLAQHRMNVSFLAPFVRGPGLPQTRYDWFIQMVKNTIYSLAQE